MGTLYVDRLMGHEDTPDRVKLRAAELRWVGAGIGRPAALKGGGDCETGGFREAGPANGRQTSPKRGAGTGLRTAFFLPAKPPVVQL
jgi:hypothetical protein